MIPIPRCGHELPAWPGVTCEQHRGHAWDHTGRDPNGHRWAWPNDDD